MEPRAILFVCLGNICRSPMAEGALRAEAARRGLTLNVDSAGTARYHVGRPPDPRAIACAARHGVDISALRARQILREDFARFDDIFALDHANLKDLRALAPAQPKARLGLLLDCVAGREGEAIADPYYGDDADFERCWLEVSAAARALCECLQTSR